MSSDKSKGVIDGLNKALKNAHLKSIKTLNEEAHLLNSFIQKRFYSSQSSSSIAVRSGRARQGWNVKNATLTNPTAIIGNPVEYSDQTKQKVIRPKKAKSLAIPVNKALTKSGVPRFTGPRDPSAPKLQLGKSKNGGAYLFAERLTAKRKLKREDIYFILLKSVTIPARLKRLPDFVNRKSDNISRRIESSINKALVGLR